jgi:hypothetical protein
MISDRQAEPMMIAAGTAFSTMALYRRRKQTTAAQFPASVQSA